MKKLLVVSVLPFLCFSCAQNDSGSSNQPHSMKSPSEMDYSSPPSNGCNKPACDKSCNPSSCGCN